MRTRTGNSGRLAILPALLLALACATPRDAGQTGAASAAAATLSPAAPAAAAAPGEPVPALRLPGDVHPLRYSLELSIAPEAERFSGTATIAIQLDRPRSVIWLHGRSLHVTEASVDAGTGPVAAQWVQADKNGMARLTLGRAVGPGAATLRLAWDAAWDQQLVGLYRAKEDGIHYAFTQFETIDARRAFPGFDEPVFKTPFDVALIVPAADVAVSNGPALGEEKLEGGKKRVRFATTPPLPTYLVAFAVGPFDVVLAPPLPPTALRDHPLQVRGIAPRGHGKQLGRALKIGNQLLLELEAYFGSAFPFEKLDHIAVPDFSYGAMENAGAITYREQSLYYEEGKTPEEGVLQMAGVMAHEMAHQWFGDLVTLRWWNDAWLNESFATWMATHVVQSALPELQAGNAQVRQAGNAMNQDSLVSARRIRQPVEKTEDIWTSFDGITYQKGASVLGMFERYAGPARFQAGIRNYIAAHRNGGGSTEELLAALSEAAGKDIAGPFATFLEQPGVPLLQAKVSCAGGKAKLLVSQSRYFPLGSKGDRSQIWQLPVCVEIGGPGPPRESCALLTAKEGEIPLGDGCPAWVLPNADGAGYYRWALARADLRALVSKGLAWSSPARAAPGTRPSPPPLSTREKISLAQSVRAALAAGAVQPGDAYAALEPLAGHNLDEELVALEPATLLQAAHRNVVTPALRPQVEAVTRLLYAPLARGLGWSPAPGEGPRRRTERRQVLELLAQTGKDPQTRREARQRGLAWLAIGAADFDEHAVDPGLAGLALGVAVEEGGPEVWSALEARLGKADDARSRLRILNALAEARDPELSARTLQLALDPRLRKNERYPVLAAQLAKLETRERAWEFLQKNLDALIAAMPESATARLLAMPPFCDAAHARAWQEFLAPKVAQLAAGNKSLATAAERMELCIAQSEAIRSGADEYFKKRAAPLTAPALR